MAEEIECSSCSYRCKTQLKLVKHTFESHSIEPTFQYKCGIKGCIHQFHSGSTFSSFKTHANRKHPNWHESISAGTYDKFLRIHIQ